jgi:hypothetical protein
MAILKTESGPPPESYGALLGEIKRRIRAAQYAALRTVNRELINLYWDIGQLIVERQTGQTWGRAVVQNLARDLQLEFPGVAGFSAPNLYKMRQFYEAYRGNENLSPLVREISWTKNLAILERCSGDEEREFAKNAVATMKTSVRITAIPDPRLSQSTVLQALRRNQSVRQLLNQDPICRARVEFLGAVRSVGGPPSGKTIRGSGDD